MRELEAKLADALVRIDILENQNKELNQIISKFAWSHDSVDDKWLARTSTSCSVRNEELSERQSAVTRNKSKSVIDDMILRNLRIFKEDIQLTVFSRILNIYFILSTSPFTEHGWKRQFWRRVESKLFRSSCCS